MVEEVQGSQAPILPLALLVCGSSFGYDCLDSLSGLCMQRGQATPEIVLPESSLPSLTLRLIPLHLFLSMGSSSLAPEAGQPCGRDLDCESRGYGPSFHGGQVLLVPPDMLTNGHRTCKLPFLSRLVGSLPCTAEEQAIPQKG